MRIGELADAGGVSAKTIRYYEAIGLLAAPQRTPAGYRDYDPAAAGRLAFIRAAQAVGLTLGEIRGVIALRDRGEPPCGHVLELIDARAAEIDQRIIESSAACVTSFVSSSPAPGCSTRPIANPTGSVI